MTPKTDSQNFRVVYNCIPLQDGTPKFSYTPQMFSLSLIYWKVVSRMISILCTYRHPDPGNVRIGPQGLDACASISALQSSADGCQVVAFAECGMLQRLHFHSLYITQLTPLSLCGDPIRSSVSTQSILTLSLYTKDCLSHLQCCNMDHSHRCQRSRSTVFQRKRLFPTAHL